MTYIEDIIVDEYIQGTSVDLVKFNGERSQAVFLCTYLESLHIIKGLICRLDDKHMR